VLANTAAVLRPASLWDARIDAVRQGGIEAVLESVLSRWFSDDFRALQPEAADRIRRMLLRTNAEG
jgi:3-oxoadipate enol-lactonase